MKNTKELYKKKKKNVLYNDSTIHETPNNVHQKPIIDKDHGLDCHNEIEKYEEFEETSTH